jgi:hypothetical protein
MMKYEDLDKDVRRTIMVHILEMASTDFSDEDLDRLTEVKLNSRQVSVYASYKRPLLTDHLFQIKNTVAIAHALAITKGTRFSYSHIRQALTANGHSIPHLSDTSVNCSLYE